MTAQVNLNTPYRRGFPWGKTLAWIGLILLLFVTVFPFWWMLRTALTAPKAVFLNTGSLLPVQATIINFQRVLGLVDAQTAVALGGSGQSINFMQAMINSIIVSAIVVAGQTTLSAMAAYAFARLRFPFNNTLFTIYIAALMVPGIVTTIPNFILIRNLGWLDTYAGIVAPTFLMTPYAVFFLRQFFLGVNREVEEAARIDGASIFTIFFRIVVPITMPALTTLAIITLIGTWNSYLWPLIVGRDESVRVLTVALGIFRSQTPQGAPDWTGLMAGTTLAIIPTFIIFMLLGRKILDSIQFSGFK
ncbi:MAG: carbohydrate ABC transporter permease [Caldilineaceae bacterium]|nr:carbohydrate ABC transporter permease [Caldilineaceae bacterium]MBP8108258.1 carbohydrate ABC transporter permease [Caldilineaceae bacterium]MBP8121651.1 carbohydrate ABC transporter permease [Caldilineaceae bacterium]MBP9071649.1 carbohydrate ABC transporter permease [Caldilineaceae bacterium]